MLLLLQAWQDVENHLYASSQSWCLVASAQMTVIYKDNKVESQNHIGVTSFRF